MTIAFNSIPSNLRVPFVAVEFDATRASQGPAQLPYRGLIIGQKLSSASGAVNVPLLVASADEVAGLAGRGSMAHRQAMAWFANNTSTESWVLLLADNGAGVAATGSFAFTGPATAAGTLALYLGGSLVQVGVAAGDAASVVATNVAAAINAAPNLPVTASAGSSTVTITHRHKGEVGNDFDLRVNYQDGEQTPAGLAVTITAMASGSTNPVLTSAIAALGDSWFHVWTHGYKDATSLTAIETELASRMGPMRMIDGLAIGSATGTQASLASFGVTRNSPSSVMVAQPGKNPLTPPSEFAAAVAAVAAYFGAIDPARPFQTLTLAGVKAPAEVDLFTRQERNLLLYDGVATTDVAAGGVVEIERLVTTYRINAAGAADDAYLDATTLLTLMYLRYAFRARIRSRYPRHKLADDGVRLGAGQAVMTPKLGAAEAIAWFRDMEALGLVEGFDQFKRDLVVVRSTTDKNRLEFQLPPDVINQLVVTAASIQFRL